MPSTVLQVRVDNATKKEAEEILNNLGLDMSTAVRLFLNRIIIEQGLPFPMTVSPENNSFFDPVEFLARYSEDKK